MINRQHQLMKILPAEVITMVDEKLDQAGDLIRERA